MESVAASLNGFGVEVGRQGRKHVLDGLMDGKRLSVPPSL